MKEFNALYEANKELDRLFLIKYPTFDQEMIKKNIIEMCVEIGELANETRCFKYWSLKGPSAKEIILDEYADCLTITLMFCNFLNVSLDEDFNDPEERELNDQFIYMYQLCSSFNDNYNKEHIKRILSNFVYLGKLLNFSTEDIINGCLLKINRNKERLERDFV